MRMRDYLPWGRRVEQRASSGSYTDLVLAAVHGAAAGAGASINKTAALEICAGTIARAMASAAVSGDARMIEPLGPSFMAEVGRQLIIRGEALYAIRVSDMGEVDLMPAAAWDVAGGPARKSWRYRLDLFGPSGNESLTMGAESVLHFRYATDPARPYLGLGPLQYASLTGRLHAEAAAAIADESSTARGQIMPMPIGGDDTSLTRLKSDMASLKGRMAFVETTAAGYGDGRDAAPRRDWEAQRLGPNFPASLVDALTASGRSVLAACGVPVELLERGDGTSSREAWRRFLFGTVAPLARLVSAELTLKLESEISLNFEELRASDLAGRARAFQSMVNGGFEIDKAAGLAGLLEPEE